MRRPEWKYDPQARAGYLTLSDHPVFVTRKVNDAVLIDLDADANIVGIEILNVDRDWTTS
jgi:uncharacterized protein YuzE